MEEDQRKFAALVTDLEVLKHKYSFENKEYKKKQEDVKVLLSKIINHITK